MNIVRTSSGKNLLYICLSTDLKILNERMGDDAGIGVSLSCLLWAQV